MPKGDLSDQQRPFDRLLDRLGAALRDRNSRKQAFGRLLKILRFILAAVSGLYAGWLIIALPLLLRFVGENNVTFAFFLYVPLQIWLLPLIPLLGCALLLLQWRLMIVLALVVPVFARWPMGHRFGDSELPTVAERPAESLTVLNNNRGQHGNQSLQPFKNAVVADLLVFQESSGRAPRFAAASTYAEFPHVAGEAEYVLLSKFPIRSHEAIKIDTTLYSPTMAARFVIDWNGRDIAVYSVHLPTPRDTLSYYRRGAFLYGVLGLPGTSWGEKREINQEGWDQRIDIARQLAEQIAADPLPTIVVGDFNAPHTGYVHSIFDDVLDDSHKTAGSGFGFTYPGTTRNPLSLGGPWMRIDHIFYDPDHWNATAAIAEKDRTSQHRANAAVLEYSTE
jgi:endonuclease/exonuclease/phosphatase (EEP) superfamily protein YafD